MNLELSDVCLTKVSRLVEFPLESSVQELIAGMKNKLLELGGVGLAAPQVGVDERVIVIRISEAAAALREHATAIPMTVLINPSYEVLDESQFRDWEACFSLPKLMGKVSRYFRIRYTAQDEGGNWISEIAEGFLARVLQHEIDHLNGKLIKDRLTQTCLQGNRIDMTARRYLELKIKAVKPYDDIESQHKQEILEWIDSGVELYRCQSPDVPPQHLAAYGFVWDAARQVALFGHHKMSGLWLPGGGHVDVNEDPAETARREIREEFKLDLEFLLPELCFVTLTQTIGLTAGHTDVGLWYLLNGDSTQPVEFDKAEFSEIKWLSLSEIAALNTDRHMSRFIAKMQDVLTHFSWGQNCEGWWRHKTPAFSVIEERMPPGTSEERHYHERVQQYFYCLSGELQIEVEQSTSKLSVGQGLSVVAGAAHQVFNKTNEDVRFLVVSSPDARDDRMKSGHLIRTLP